jgi:glycosyltransferase involved in cell wall biosynthesis
MEKSDLRVSFVSTFPPRQCGIGTYTKALTRVMDDFFLKRKTKIAAISDNGYRYPDKVFFTINQEYREEYARAADFLNQNACEVVSIQHEYGIYGGEFGEYLVELMSTLKKPCVTTLHSVVPVHTAKRKQITQQIIDLSNAIVVMTGGSKATLEKIFRVDPGKIRVIHHGVPNVRPDEREKAKLKLGLDGRFVALTFGLLNPGKGIEYAIDALPHVVCEIPHFLYIIAGRTHPVILKRDGERYRETLEQKVRDLGLTKHVKFINKYLDYKTELVEYLKATDVYIAPQTDPHQSASGTIAYAIGAGVAVISTPTAYAQEVLANGRGYLVDFLDSVGIAKKLLVLARSPQLLDKKRMKTYLYGRRMIWPVVGLEHLKVFEGLAYGQPRQSRIPVRAFTKTPELIPS